jgi:hypothetical protein
MYTFEKAEKDEIAHRLRSRYFLRTCSANQQSSKKLLEESAYRRIESALRSMHYIGPTQKPNELEIRWIAKVACFLAQSRIQNWSKKLAATPLRSLQKLLLLLLEDIDPQNLRNELAQLGLSPSEKSTLLQALAKFEEKIPNPHILEGLAKRWRLPENNIPTLENKPRLNPNPVPWVEMFLDR